MAKAGSKGGLRRSLLALILGLVWTLLGGLLLLQAFLLCNGSLGFPTFLLPRLHEQLEERGWHADYQTLRYYPPASLIVKDLQLTPQGEPQALLTIDIGRIDFSATSLLRGEVEMTELAVYGGTVFCPARLSPTGVREPVLEKAHTIIGSTKEGWEIRNLSGKFQNVSFVASGVLPRLPERKDPPEELERLLSKWLPQIVRERAAFERVENPHVRLALSSSPAGGLSIEADIWADGFYGPVVSAGPLPYGGPVRVLQPHLKTRWSYEGARWVAEAASLDAASVAWETLATAERVSADFLWSAGEAGNLVPDGANLAIGQLRTEAGALNDFRLSVAHRSEQRLEADFFSFFQDEPLEGVAELDWGRGDGRAEILSRINPTQLLRSEIARDLGLRYDIWFGEAPFVRAAAAMENWRFASAVGHAKTRMADIDGVFMHRAAATAELRPDRFHVPEMFLAYDDFEAEGSYKIDFATKEYRLLFHGSARPLHISAWFRDWWVRLWEDFHFSDGPLQGDVDIRGIMGDSDEVTVAGSVGAENLSIRAVPFKSINGKVIFAGASTDFFDIEVVREEGNATGAFQYQSNGASSGFGRLWFDIDSTVDPTEVAAVFGEAGPEFMSAFQFSVPPSLSARGAVYGAPHADETRILIHGEAAAPLEYHGLPLSRLKMTARINGAAWELTELSAGLAGGEVTGGAEKWEEKEVERLGFTLNLQGLDLEQTLDAVAQWQAKRAVPVTQVRDLRGTLDASLDASGVYGDFESFVGEGSVRIREADLAEVHLLGILSRILSATPLGFTSLQFREADARFRMDRNQLHFDDLQLMGPTSALRASGDYFIDQNALDASLRIYLLKQSKIPLLSLILSPLLEPLAHVLEIRLTGPVADPQWRFLFGPRNILKTISTGGTEAAGEDPPEE